MQNLEDLDVFEILITQNLLKCPKDPFVRSALKYILVTECKRIRAKAGSLCYSSPKIIRTSDSGDVF